MQYSDLSSPAFYANPYPVYKEMRDAGPIVGLAPRIFIAGRHSVVEALLLDRRMGKAVEISARARYGEERAQGPLFRSLGRMLINRNPPSHTRPRSLLMKAFNARQIERFRQIAHDVANGLVDDLLAADHADLVKDYALPLPMEIICMLLGVPREEAEAFSRSAYRLARILDATAMPDQQFIETEEAMLTLQGYFALLVEQRRRDPGDDLISQLLSVEEDKALSQ
jgi:cytochrome P450